MTATSFFLGILFSLFPYDYPLLWTPSKCPPSAFDNLENHLKILHSSPLLIPRILHTIIGTGFLGLFMKLYKPSDSNQLFDGASLALYTIGVIIYLTNIVKALRMVTDGSYGEIIEGESTLGNPERNPDGSQTLGRDDSLKVLSASNTILALVLLGVLVLQTGQWYAERKQGQEMEEMEKEKEGKKGEVGKHRPSVAKKKQ